MKHLTDETIYNVAAQGLDADSALKLAVKMGYVDQSAEDAARAISGMKAMLLAGKIGPEQYADSVSRMNDAINRLHDRNVTVTMTAIIQEIARIRGYESGVEGGLMGGGRAYGGAVGAGVPYIIGERGAESFVPQQAGIVIPHNVTTTINNNITTDRMGVALAMERGAAMSRAQARM